MDQATDKKNDIKNCVTRYVYPCSVNFKIKWQAKTTGLSIVSTCTSEKREISLGWDTFWDTFYIHMSATMNWHVI